MPTLTWRGPSGGLWQDASNWLSPDTVDFPPPPVPGDIAQADAPAVINGSGAADQFQTTNSSGSVELNGNFNIGTIFNGDLMSLGGTITSKYIETFVQLNLTGDITAVDSLTATYQGIVQFNGSVSIGNGGTVDASSYTVAYNGGSSDQPNENQTTIDGALLDIVTVPIINASNEVVGGFAVIVPASVMVDNGGSLTTPYLTLEDPNAIMVVAGAEVDVPYTTTDPADYAVGTNIDGGTLEIENSGSLFSTYLLQSGDASSAFIVDNAIATISAGPTSLNGLQVTDGDVFFRNDSTITASQIYLSSPVDPDDTDGPSLTITSSTVKVTGTEDVPDFSFAGIWLADGQTAIYKASDVQAQGLQIDSPAVADPTSDLGNFVTIYGGSTLSIDDDALLGLTGGSSVELDLSDDDTNMLFGGQLIVADGPGDEDLGDGATASISIDSGAKVSVNDNPDSTGLVAIGANAGDDGEIEVIGDGSALVANDAIVGDSGQGFLLADGGGSIYVSGSIDLGEDDGGSGTLQVAGVDGSGDVTVGELNVGENGDGSLYFDSLDGLNHGTLTVTGDAYAGVFDGGSGTVLGNGGSFSVGGDFYAGDEGDGFVGLGTMDVDIGGDLIIGNGGQDAGVALQDVTLTVDGTVFVGSGGAGFLDWGSSVEQSTSLDTVVIGETSDGVGIFTLRDPTTLLTIGTLVVGNEGDGTFDIFNGATVDVTNDGGIGLEDDSAGRIILQAGTDDLGDEYPNGGSSITFDQDLFVGDGGTGYMLVGDTDEDGDGAIATINGNLLIGDEADAFGTVVVGGDYVDQDGSVVASLLTVGGDIVVGIDAVGTLDPITGTFDPGGVLSIANGATVDATADGAGLVDVAQGGGSSGAIDVNSATLNANTLDIGDAGDGTLTINNGAVLVTGDFVVGDSADSTGTVDVDGDSLLQSDDSMIIGAGATPYVNDGTIEYPTILNATDGAVIANDGTGDDAFVIGFDPGSLGEAIIDGSTLDVNAAVIGEDGSGVLEITNGGSAIFGDDVILGDGTAAFGGMDVSDSDVDFYGTLDVGEEATGATINGTFIPGALLTIEDGSTFLDQDYNGIDIAVDPGSTGAMIVDDSDVEPTFITIGDQGDGTLTVRNDGSLYVDPDDDVEIGTAPSASGTVTVDGGVLGYGSELDVGVGGDGVLDIINGGTVGPDEMADDTDVTIADDDTSTGTLTVDDSLLITDDITIGNSGAGTLTVQNGGTVDTAGDATISALGAVLGGPAGSGTGTVTLLGNGGTIDDTLWKIDGQLAVGDFGSGTLVVNFGATLTAGDEFDVASESEGSFGSIGNGLVSSFGSNSLIEADGPLFVGADGKGTVALAGNAELIAKDDVTFGDGINSAGSLMISGATFMSNGGDVSIGEEGTGFVQVAFGGDFNAGSSDVVLGDTDLGKGTLNLVTIGSGNPTAETGDLTVGEEGTGSLSVMGNGLVTTDGDAVIGDTGVGDVVINGISAAGTFDPATWTIDGDLSIGGLTTAGGGVGTLAVSNNGIVQVAGEVVMWNDGTIINNSATRGLIEIGGTTLTSGTQIVIDAAVAATTTTAATPQGTLSGGGTILSNILDNGLIDLTNGQSLVIFGSIVGFGTLLLDGTAVMEVNGAIASTVTIDFDSGAGQTDVLELDTPLAVKGTIYNLGSSDGIDLLGVKFAGSSFNIVNDVLTVINGGSTVAALALGGTTYSAAAFSLTEDGSGNAEIVFENPVPPPVAPTLTMPAELPAFPLSFGEYLTGTSGIYLSDPDAPVNSTYTLTLNDATGTMFVLYGNDTTQTDSAGSDPIKFIGSLAEINADLNHLVYVSGGTAFGHQAAPPDTITASLVRGDGVTVTGAIGYNPPPSDASIVYSGPTTVALGQAISLSFTPSDPLAASLGNDQFGIDLNTSSNARAEAPFNGYLLALNEFAAEGGVTAYYLNDEGASLASLASDLGGGNLLFVPTGTGTVPIDGSFYEFTGNGDIFPDQTANFTVNVTVTAATRTKAVTDDWTGAVSAELSTAGNWSQNFAPGTTDTAVFAPIAGVPVISTTGGGVAAAWDIDASTTFAGVVDATRATGGAALDIDQGATATFLDGSGLFAASLFNGSIDGEALAAIRGNAVIVGNTAPSALDAANADIVTGEVTIGNDASAGGSQMTLMNVFWAPEGNTQTGNPGDVLVGNNGYGVLTLINTSVDNVEAQNYQAAGYGQIQIGQDNPGAAGSGGLGVFFDSQIRDSVQVGYFGPGELVMGGGAIGNAINIQYVSLAVHGGRVDWGGGATLYIVNGLDGSDPATIDGGSVVSGDDWTISNQGSGDNLTNDGTLEAAAGLPSSIFGINVEGSGTLLIDAGGTLDLDAGSEAPTVILSGQTVVFQPEINGTGGLLSLGEPGDFHGTIEAFADGDRIALPAGESGVTVASAVYSAGNNTTAVDFSLTEDGGIPFGGTITFAGSLSVGNFLRDSAAPAGYTVFDYVEAGVAAQPPIISVPGNMTATDGVANPIPGLSLSDEDAARNHLKVQVTLTPVSGNAGTFVAPTAAGVTITGNDTETITVSGALAAVQAELAGIGFTPTAGYDEYIQVTASDGVSQASPVTFLAHNSSDGTAPGFTGTENYIYTGPAAGSFDTPGFWQDGSSDVYPSGPGIADSATIVSNPLIGQEDVIGGIGVAGQLLTEGLVVLTGSLSLGGLPLAGIGTVQGSGPAFAGALEAGTGNLILASGAKLDLGGDLIVTGSFDSIADNPWSIAGDIHINGGTLALGGLGALAVTGTVEAGGTTGSGGVLDVLGNPTSVLGSAPVLTSAAALIGNGAGTAVVNVANSSSLQAWAIAGALVVGASGDAEMTIGTSPYDNASPAVSASSVTVGQSAGVTATLSVWAGATLDAATILTVGNSGTGTLDVGNGDASDEGDGGGAVLVGSTASPGELDIGGGLGGVGVVDVSVNGAITVDGSAYLGGTSEGESGGTGTLAISDSSFFPSYGGLFDVTGGFTAYDGTVLLRGGSAEMGSVTIESGATLSGDGYVTGPGVETGNLTDPTIINTSAPLTTIVDDGLIDANVDPASGAALLSLYGSVSGTGTLDIEAGATVDIEGSVAAGLHVMFDGPGAELILSQPGSFAPVIDGFQAGDEIRMSGVAPGAVDYDTSTGLLTDTVGGSVYSFVFDPPSGSFAAVTDTHDGTLLELTPGPVITAPGTLTVGVGKPEQIPNVALAGTSTETGDTFSVTLSDKSGLLSASGTGVSGSNSKSLTITGSVSSINDDLETLSDTDGTTPSDTITISAADETQDVPASPQTIAVTVNGLPMIAVPGAQTIESGQTYDISGISLSESGDTGQETFTATLTDASGLLAVTPDGTEVTGQNSNDLRVSGPLGDVNDALNSLTADEASAGSNPITVNASDSYGNVAQTATVTVTANSQPMLSAPSTLVLGEGIITDVTGVSVNETGNTTGEQFTVTLLNTNGQLSVDESDGVYVTGSPAEFYNGYVHPADAYISLIGSLIQVQDALETLTDKSGIPGPDTIFINGQDDDGGTATQVTIDVTVNGGPVIDAPSGATVTQSTPTPIANVGLSESGDITNETFTVTVSDTYGLLSTSNPGGAIIGGPDSTSITISGSLSDVNTALENLDDTDSTAATDTIKLNATDGLGNTDGPVPITVTVSQSGPQLAGAVTLTSATAGTPLPGTTEVASFTDTNLTDTAGTFAAEIDWGDGSSATGTITGSGGSFAVDGGHTYADEGDDPLSVTITDTANDTQLPLSGTVDVTDGNVLIGQGVTFAANTDEAFNGTVATFTDLDTITPASDLTATIDWGDGTSSTSGTVTESDGSFAVSGDHTYASSGQDTVTVTLSDAAPGTAIGTAVSTADVEPQLAGAVTLASATAGTPLPGTTEVASFTDTNLTDTAGTFAAEIDWGDGSSATGTITGSDGSFAVDGGHTYNDEGNDSLSVTITDTANEMQLPLSGTVEVVDGNVLAGQGVTIAATAGMAFDGTVANFTDTDIITPASDFTATVDWGDGTPLSVGTVSGSDGLFSVSAPHSYASSGVDTIAVTLSDIAPGTASATATSTADVGQTFILTKGADIVSGGPGDNVIIAGSNTLSAGDEIDGGTEGINSLDLTTAGTFNLKLPSILTDIQIVNAQEGQAAYFNGTQSFTATNQIVTLRNGLNVTVDVSAALVNPLNPKPATITIIGANDASVINLASGNDVVTVGSAAETVTGGSGDDQIQVTASTIGAAIDGGTGQSTLDVLGGGSVVMGTSVTNISSVLLASTPNAMSFIANGIAGLVVDDASSGADTVTAGGQNQRLSGGAGKETFDGFSGGSTTFSDAAGAINGDTINDFQAIGDAIDITNLAVSSPDFAFNPVQNGASVTLNVTDGTHSAAVTLNGSFNVADFRTGPDTGSGTLITYAVK